MADDDDAVDAVDAVDYGVPSASGSGKANAQPSPAALYYQRPTATIATTTATVTMALSAEDKIRVLVVGDSGVGKTAVVQRVATGSAGRTPRWTVGCEVTVMRHTVVGRHDARERAVLVEFWDVGGHRDYADSRAVFYHNVNAIWLVHDVSNRKTLANLRSWLDEICREDADKRAREHHGVEEEFFVPSRHQQLGSFAVAHRPTAAARAATTSSSALHTATAMPAFYPTTTPSSTTAAPTPTVLNGLPILVVGNKTDAVSSRFAMEPPTPFESRFDFVRTSAVGRANTKPPDWDKLCAFLNRVAERRFGW